jgi:hypothetical protein
LSIPDGVQEVSVSRKQGDALDVGVLRKLDHPDSYCYVDLRLHLLFASSFALPTSESLLLVFSHVDFDADLLQLQIEHLILGHAVVIVSRDKKDFVKRMANHDLEASEELLELGFLLQPQTCLMSFVHRANAYLQICSINNQNVRIRIILRNILNRLWDNVTTLHRIEYFGDALLFI